MKLRDIYNTENLTISFEVFPPKNGIEILEQELKILREYQPAFISLTCGAGGKDNKSFELVKNIQQTGLDVMAHFTCISSSYESVASGLDILEKMNIENILALRGDIPEDISLRKFDFNHANELVRFIKSKTSLSVGVAGYPEGHIESIDMDTDIKYLKLKVNSGADVIFTQLFFDNRKFFEYTDKVKTTGINIPIVAGIMPIISKKQIEKMTTLAKITVPNKVQNAIEKYNGSDVIKFGIDYATEQCCDLLANNQNNLHFYTLNKSCSVSKILDNIRR